MGEGLLGMNRKFSRLVNISQLLIKWMRNLNKNYKSWIKLFKIMRKAKKINNQAFYRVSPFRPST